MSWSLTIQKAVSDYQKHLKQNCTKHLQKHFDNQFAKGNPEGAISEAIIFLWLEQINLNPKVEENEIDGGADFICKYNNHYEFIVEVTCIKDETLENATLGQKTEHSPAQRIMDGQHLIYKLPLTAIKSKVKGKKDQLSKYALPTVLVITSLHEWAGVFWLGNKREVEKLLLDVTYKTSQDNYDELEIIGNLKNSLFLEFTQNSPPIKYRNQFVSAVLLIPIKVDESNLSIKPIGLLHPKPFHPLDIQVFPNMEFAQTILDEEGIEIDWINT